MMINLDRKKYQKGIYAIEVGMVLPLFVMFVVATLVFFQLAFAQASVKQAGHLSIRECGIIGEPTKDCFVERMLVMAPAYACSSVDVMDISTLAVGINRRYFKVDFECKVPLFINPEPPDNPNGEEWNMGWNAPVISNPAINATSSAILTIPF